MSSQPLENRYFRRMAGSLAEKTDLVDHLVPGSVVDVGAGGGELAAQMAARSHITTVWALDHSIDAMTRLNEINSINAVHGDVTRLAEFEPVDNIVFSSVLHEIYSYAATTTPVHSDDSLRRALYNALRLAIDALAPGGRLIIRDFVLPEDSERPMWLVTPGDNEDGLLYEYFERTPFADLIVLDEVDEHVFQGTARSVSEALLTLNWGKESLPREAQERYGLYNLDGYAALICELSEEMSLLDSRAWIQPGYQEHLSGWECREQDGEHWFPNTKALWVFEKASS